MRHGIADPRRLGFRRAPIRRPSHVSGMSGKEMCSLIYAAAGKEMEIHNRYQLTLNARDTGQQVWGT